jgi:hypothetical protein
MASQKWHRFLTCGDAWSYVINERSFTHASEHPLEPTTSCELLRILAAASSIRVRRRVCRCGGVVELAQQQLCRCCIGNHRSGGARAMSQSLLSCAVEDPAPITEQRSPFHDCCPEPVLVNLPHRGFRKWKKTREKGSVGHAPQQRLLLQSAPHPPDFLYGRSEFMRQFLIAVLRPSW